MSAAGWPLLGDGDLQAPLAWRAGRAISRAQFLRQAQALSSLLPDRGPLLALTNDRYRFALSLAAALWRGQPSLLPPNHTPDLMARLAARFEGLHALVDELPAGTAAPTGLSMRPWPVEVERIGLDEAAAAVEPPWLPADQVCAQVLTSGSTGEPVPHDKAWGALVVNIRAEARRVAEHLGRADLQGVTLVGTVPAQHMYGFESTVLLALLGGAAFAAQRPFFPADVVQVLESVPRPRVLVTTPFHLRTLVASGLVLPPVDLIISATAPLSPQLAQRAELALAGPLMEIYGCTEAGQVATRRCTAGPDWRTFDGLSLQGDGAEAIVSGGHVPAPVMLADVLEVLAPDRFRLLGRSNDLINVAGKRSSLSHLNFHLNSIDGVVDGVFHLPPADGAEDMVRLVAVVVAPSLTREALLAALRQRVDPVFLPRRIHFVDTLPRDPTGKLPAGRLADWVVQLAASASRGG
ncbi:AMP-binding enzyme [Sphaerotilus hippei]|uniref:Long-chain-fatty-acid--CoA ligase n=1 Tax=Sphaerotilus hippei TaxID=744406 RepID=A0A318H5K1_9BURK|nr:AMP-binding protein [Sphaerotilus hippei]PXW96630.1 AMP-binding enzyme [Sphaerotilus hippei]